MPFFFKWQNFKRLWWWCTDWYDLDWPPKSIWLDKSWHLFRKLSSAGFSGESGQLFKSYLSNCIFSVNLKDFFSEIPSILCHVQQGSVLGPLLFMVYVDMSMALKYNLILYADDMRKCNLFLYADNTWLVFQSKNVKDMEKQVKEEFANIYNWFVDNKVFTSEKIKVSPVHTFHFKR